MKCFCMYCSLVTYSGHSMTLLSQRHLKVLQYEIKCLFYLSIRCFQNYSMLAVFIQYFHDKSGSKGHFPYYF